MATSTPWGKAYLSERIAVGIMKYYTESHGGYHLSPTRQAQLHPTAGVKNWNGSLEWWEEDSDWAVVFLSFPTEFQAHMPKEEYEFSHKCAVQTVQTYHPHFAQAIGVA